MFIDAADEVKKENFNSFKNRYQNNVESIKDSDFAFEHVCLLYCKWYKINLSQGGSCIDSPDWTKNNNKSHQ